MNSRGVHALVGDHLGHSVRDRDDPVECAGHRLVERGADFGGQAPLPEVPHGAGRLELEILNVQNRLGMAELRGQEPDRRGEQGGLDDQDDVRPMLQGLVDEHRGGAEREGHRREKAPDALHAPAQQQRAAKDLYAAQAFLRPRVRLVAGTDRPARIMRRRRDDRDIVTLRGDVCADLARVAADPGDFRGVVDAVDQNPLIHVTRSRRATGWFAPGGSTQSETMSWG
jgi:hypothetical protein